MNNVHILKVEAADLKMSSLSFLLYDLIKLSLLLYVNLIIYKNYDNFNIYCPTINGSHNFYLLRMYPFILLTIIL